MTGDFFAAGGRTWADDEIARLVAAARDGAVVLVDGGVPSSVRWRGHEYGFRSGLVAAEAIGAVLVVRTADGMTWECGPRPGDVRLVRPDECAEPTVLTAH